MAASAKAFSNFDTMVATADKTTLPYLQDKLKAALQDKSKLDAELKETAAALQKAQRSEEKAGRHLESVNELIELLANTKGKALVELRTKLRAEIRQLVERIETFPDGLHDRVLNLQDLSEIRYARVTEPTDSGEALAPAEVEQYIQDNTGKEHRAFGVFFKGGGFQEVRLDGGTYRMGIAGDSGAEILAELVGQE